MRGIRTAASAVLAPVFGSATAYGRTVLGNDAAVRARLPVCRRLGFVQLAVGSGTTTTAAAVLTVLARRRAGMVLGVDASPSPSGLLARIGAGPDPRDRDAAAVRSGATTAAQACAGLPRSRGGGYGLDLRPGRAGQPATADSWSAAVGPIARFYDVVGTDWGLRHPAYDLEPVLTSSHAVCLAVRAEADGVAAAAALLHGLAARPARPPVVVALIGVDADERPARLAGYLPAPVVRIEHDPNCRSGRPGRNYRVGCLRLAAALLHASSPPEGGHRDR